MSSHLPHVLHCTLAWTHPDPLTAILSPSFSPPLPPPPSQLQEEEKRAYHAKLADLQKQLAIDEEEASKQEVRCSQWELFWTAFVSAGGLFFPPVAM